MRNDYAEIAPTGTLRVGMNGSNPALVQQAADGTVSGLCADFGQFVAGKLGIPYQPLVYDSAATYTKSFDSGEWDMILTGRNPFAGSLVDFVSDVILMEYVFVAAPGRSFANPNDVDQPGIRIGVPRNASADVFLSRTLKVAELVRVPGDAASAIELLRSGGAEAYASSMNSLLVIADTLPGAKMVPGAFETIAFAVSMPKGRSAAAHKRLKELVDEAKAARIVQKAIDKSGLQGVRPAP